jgi:hypothetical protein
VRDREDIQREILRGSKHSALEQERLPPLALSAASDRAGGHSLFEEWAAANSAVAADRSAHSTGKARATPSTHTLGAGGPQRKASSYSSKDMELDALEELQLQQALRLSAEEDEARQRSDCTVIPAAPNLSSHDADSLPDSCSLSQLHRRHIEICGSDQASTDEDEAAELQAAIDLSVLLLSQSVDGAEDSGREGVEELRTPL